MSYQINKPSGYSSKDCDAGLPVSGRTSPTGEYEIIKVNADGSVCTTNLAPIDTSSAYLGINPTYLSLTPGAPTTNTFLGYASVTANNITAGVYRINPTFVYQGSPGGGISFVLYKDTTALGVYVSALPFGNAFAPALGDIQTGLCAYWHNTTSQAFGTNLQIAYNRNNSIDVYLDAGIYYMAIITDGAVVITNTNGRYGHYEFTKIS